EDRLCDDLALDLVGTAVDRWGEGPPYLELHAVLTGISRATHQLHPLKGRALGDLRGTHLGHGRRLGKPVLLAVVDRLRDVVDERPRRLDVRGEVSDPMP